LIFQEKVKNRLKSTNKYIFFKKLLMSYSIKHLKESKEIINSLDYESIENIAKSLANLKFNSGRLFLIGVGGSAANCSHAVNDFRKICGFEAYTPTDNVAELTARVNDEGWETVFTNWLKVSKLNANDGVFIFSVGGGDLKNNISTNIVSALKYAKKCGSKIFGVVGRNGGYTKEVGDHVCVIPTVNNETITPHTEAFQALVWHLLVSHPLLKQNNTKWESQN